MMKKRDQKRVDRALEQIKREKERKAKRKKVERVRPS
jgi:hypothetical protein